MSVQSVDQIRDDDEKKRRLKVRQTAIDRAWDDFEKAVDKARVVFRKEVDTAWKDYKEGMTK